MSSTYEHIVLGVGGIGGAAAYWLARRGGGDVLAIEQYRLGHDRGASEDHSRIIRHSYHTTEYTSLTRAAYDHMRDLEHETGLELLRITGGLHLAPNDSAGNAEIGSYAHALAEQGHDRELMDGTELRKRWPQWRVGADVVGLYQAESGILADLAIDGRTDYPIAAFSINRPAVRDPGFPSDFRFSRAAQAPHGDSSPGTSTNPAQQSGSAP
jgi:sarcosine oxidase